MTIGSKTTLSHSARLEQKLSHLPQSHIGKRALARRRPKPSLEGERPPSGQCNFLIRSLDLYNGWLTYAVQICQPPPYRIVGTRDSQGLDRIIPQFYGFGGNSMSISPNVRLCTTGFTRRGAESGGNDNRISGERGEY